MLDLCCNSGAFALAALKAGAVSAVLVDRAQQALGAAEATARANGLADRTRFIRADMFEEAERQREAGSPL